MEFIKLPNWENARQIHSLLECDGWVTPDTYSKIYTPLADDPAVYLFLIHDREDFSKALVGYVGMATRLRRRMTNHPVFRDIERTPSFWPMRWFKVVKPDALRVTEKAYIQRFDPPWNLIGRTRGISVT